MENNIFTVTTIREDHDNRCVGWYPNLQQAMRVVLDNAGDIYEEGSYPYCVIESVPSGLYSFPREETWFEWTGGCYVQIPKPEIFKQIACFGIG